MKGYPYILQNEIVDKFYIGSTNNLGRRLSEYNSKRWKNRFTYNYGNWRLIYKEEYPILSEARKRERQIKKWKNKERIKQLINRAHNNRP